VAVLGDETTPPARQPGIRAAFEQPDGREALRLAVAGIAEIEARVAPLIPVYHAVAQAPAGAVFRRSEELRRDGMAELAQALAAKAPLQPGMTLPRASDSAFRANRTRGLPGVRRRCRVEPRPMGRVDERAART
jgi:hypothetical protein